MFIVAITLGILAAIGVYGLSATAVDVRAAGHLREAAQAESAAEHGIALAADSFTPGTAGELIRAMQSGTTIQATNCQTANAFNSAAEPNSQYRSAQACLSWNTAEMENINGQAGGPNPGANPWWTSNLTGPPKTADRSTFSADSFGQVPDKPYLRVEITNPVDIPPPPGTSLNDRYTFTQVTATVFVDMKTASGNAPDSTIVGRGRMTVGPYFRQ
jgi:hypothetical protein